MTTKGVADLPIVGGSITIAPVFFVEQPASALVEGERLQVAR
jgi:hypothetical protein